MSWIKHKILDLLICIWCVQNYIDIDGNIHCFSIAFQDNFPISCTKDGRYKQNDQGIMEEYIQRKR